MADPAQILKAHIGELMWTNAILASQLEEKTKELEALQKKETKDA